MLRRACSVLLIAYALSTGGCGSDGSTVSPAEARDPGFPASAAFPGLVSDPAPSWTASSATGDPDVVYVSVTRGTVQTAVSAVIANHRTKRFAAVTVIEGGFDPVPIGARAADTIVVTFNLSGGFASRTWTVAPHARRPALVRTEPREVDSEVPLDASMLIVFSEPIDARSSATSLVALKRNDETVQGTAQLVTEQPWLVRFVPAAPLERDQTYELVAVDELRDLDGDRLEAPPRLSFRTAGSREGRLAFSSWTGSASAIYTVRPDGSALTRVVDGIDPRFSPDGQRIAFWRYDRNVAVVYIANVDGTGVRKVSEGYQPTWAPDGRRLALGCGGICIVYDDGTGLTRLTPAAPVSKTGDVCIRETDPAWSPDGSTIAFVRWPDDRIPESMCLPLGVALNFPFDFWTRVYLMGTDGGNQRLLLDRPEPAPAEHWPAWSPDGQRLAYRVGDGLSESMDVANVDGSGVVTAFRRSPPRWESVLGSPAWSPDGSRIVFSAPGGWSFVDASGSGNIRLVASPGNVVPNSFSWAWSSP